MTKRTIIPEIINNEAASRAHGTCECDNLDCDHIAGECPRPADDFEARAAFWGEKPSDAAMKQRVKWMCGECYSQTPLPLLEQV